MIINNKINKEKKVKTKKKTFCRSRSFNDTNLKRTQKYFHLGGGGYASLIMGSYTGMETRKEIAFECTGCKTLKWVKNKEEMYAWSREGRTDKIAICGYKDQGQSRIKGQHYL